MVYTRKNIIVCEVFDGFSDLKAIRINTGGIQSQKQAFDDAVLVAGQMDTPTDCSDVNGLTKLVSLQLLANLLTDTVDD